MKSCIIFDLDGTLIDSRADIAAGVNLMRASYGLPPLSLDTVTGYVGNGARKLAERSLRGTGINLEVALAVMKKFYMENLFDKTSLYPGVKEGLQVLYDAKIPLAIITNKPTKPCQSILKHFGISDFFRFAIGGDSGFPLKPDPAAFLYVAEKTGAVPEQSWMLGDNYTDLESGRRAGMQRCFAAYGFGKPHDEPWDLSVDSFPEFVEKVIPRPQNGEPQKAACKGAHGV